MSLVLDTHIFLWWFDNPARLSKSQVRALKKVNAETPALLSDISLWEISMLVSLGRLRPKIPLREWFEVALERPHLELQPITPAIACEVTELSSRFHKDPADRIIVATARILGATLLTADELIIDSGLVPVIC
ncbi:MAG: type II toxin-antitoxin system VapC family toxin [Myxococcaceae bacterium]